MSQSPFLHMGLGTRIPHFDHSVTKEAVVHYSFCSFILCRSQGVHSQNPPEVHISNGTSSGLKLPAPISTDQGEFPTDTAVTPGHKAQTSMPIKYADVDLESQEGSVRGIKSSVKYSKVKSS